MEWTLTAKTPAKEPGPTVLINMMAKTISGNVRIAVSTIFPNPDNQRGLFCCAPPKRQKEYLKSMTKGPNKGNRNGFDHQTDQIFAITGINIAPIRMDQAIKDRADNLTDIFFNTSKGHASKSPDIKEDNDYCDQPIPFFLFGSAGNIIIIAPLIYY